VTQKPKSKSILDAMGLGDEAAPIERPANEGGRTVVTVKAGQVASGKPAELAIDAIEPDPKQPRRAFDPEKIEAMAASMIDAGVLQPILVRKSSEDSSKWIIVDGERRWRAATIAGLKTVPVIYRDDLSGEAIRRLYIQTMANAHSEGLSDLETARVVDQLVREGYKKGEFCEELGIKANRVAGFLSMLKPDVLPHVEAGVITAARVAEVFASLDGEGKARALRMASESGGPMTRPMAEQARNAPAQDEGEGEGEGGEQGEAKPAKAPGAKAPKPPKAPTTVKLQLSVEGLRRLADKLGEGEAADVVLPVVRGEALIAQLASHFDPAEEDLASRLRDLLNAG
jgi:ParB family chromosome partitioning protein